MQTNKKIVLVDGTLADVWIDAGSRITVGLEHHPVEGPYLYINVTPISYLYLNGDCVIISVDSPGAALNLDVYEKFIFSMLGVFTHVHGNRLVFPWRRNYRPG